MNVESAKMEAKSTVRHLWMWFLAGFAATFGFVAARALLMLLGWWR